MVQLHWWDYDVAGLRDTMLVLADLQADGQIQSLGTTNLDTQAIEMLTDADIRLVSNQVDLLPALSVTGTLHTMHSRHGEIIC